MSGRENERRSTIASTTGGVMTDEVGAVTGDLEISTRPLDAGPLDVHVRYSGAEEWYTVTGSPVSASGRYPKAELHERIVEHLTRLGETVDDNEEPASLRGFPGP